MKIHPKINDYDLLQDKMTGAIKKMYVLLL